MLDQRLALVSRVRNAITLVRGKGSDQLPHDIRERAAVANVLGYPAGATDQMVNDYLRTHAGLPRRGGPGVLGVSVVPARA